MLGDGGQLRRLGCAHSSCASSTGDRQGWEGVVRAGGNKQQIGRHSLGQLGVVGSCGCSYRTSGMCARGAARI
jgi:hypothetical protein